MAANRYDERMFRLITLALVVAAFAAGQEPRGLYPWWSAEITRELELSHSQQTQIDTYRDVYMPQLTEARRVIQFAEDQLQKEFAKDPVDQEKAKRAIEKLGDAHAALARLQAEMQLKMRNVLTAAQWAKVEKRRPMPGRRLTMPQ